MGGHGALRLAFRYPDTFMSVVAFAPAIWKPGGVSDGNSPMKLLSPDQREAWFPNTTGQSFDPEIQKQQSPFASLSDLSEMSNPPAVMLAVGDDDYFDFHDGTVEMYIELRRLALEPELRVTDGGHDAAFIRSVLPDAFAFFDEQFIAARQ